MDNYKDIIQVSGCELARPYINRQVYNKYYDLEDVYKRQSFGKSMKYYFFYDFHIPLLLYLHYYIIFVRY